MHSLYASVLTLIQQVSETIILPRYQHLSAGDIEEKAPNDLVTIADKQCELELTAKLSRLLPGSHVVGEEACAAEPSTIDTIGQGLCWVIDPIDGTGNFVAGKPPFGVMVALLEEGETQAGWIYDPLTQRICHAVRGGGAFINGERIHDKTCNTPKPIAAISEKFMSREQAAHVLARLEGHFTLAPIPRCAAEQYPRLVLGENDISLFERTLAWDHAAGALFLTEAGGKIARLDGSAYTPDNGSRKGMLAASSPAYWEQAAALLNAAPED
jgi:fructose-1,6-bisphosphatase/inositol monophosphatase family enzyme